MPIKYFVFFFYLICFFLDMKECWDIFFVLPSILDEM